MLDWWLPENVSTYGGDVDSLFYLIFYITGVAWILVQALMIVFLVQYRHREGRRATYTHGNTTLEIMWTIVPALILVMIGFLSKATWDKIRHTHPPSTNVVEITAKQFNWEILYPGPDGKFQTGDDKMIENDLHVPVNQVVRVRLKSKDVIHSFFVPQFRLKQDAVPGRTIEVWFEATKPGKYELPCAELCGFGHSGMLGHVTVQTAEEFQAWTKEQWPS
jgi:cytochrome c oxidase subunit II